MTYTIYNMRVIDEWSEGRKAPEDEGPIFYATGYMPGAGSFGRPEFRTASGSDQYEARENLLKVLGKL